MNLTGRVAIVTGAGRGLGKAISLAFELSGANVALFSLLKDELDDVSADLDKLGGEYLLHAGDTTDEQEVASVVAETISRFGRIDILVNNAGIIGPARFLEDTLPTDWKQTLDVNLTGCYLFCRKVLPHMVRPWQRQDHKHRIGPRSDAVPPILCLFSIQSRPHPAHQVTI